MQHSAFQYGMLKELTGKTIGTASLFEHDGLMLTFQDGSSFFVLAQDGLQLFGDAKLLGQKRQKMMVQTDSQSELMSILEQATSQGMEVVQIVYDVKNNLYYCIIDQSKRCSV